MIPTPVRWLPGSMPMILADRESGFGIRDSEEQERRTFSALKPLSLWERGWGEGSVFAMNQPVPGAIPLSTRERGKGFRTPN
jgi:hypothetical protein